TAGLFEVKTSRAGEPRNPGLAGAEDTALLLHTSGTTSRPKLVPLLHRNLCSSASNICHTLRLTAQDRCLNVMPLFHIHGLVAAILASLRAGACIVCTEGFHAVKFFRWMEEFQPTWYTAVPTMHQALLARAAREPGLPRSGLRFVRSSSASLPPTVMADLEELFDAPVIEAYGMTEAAHQMTSNLLPPGNRKPGSVGPSGGPEVAIIDEPGNVLPNGGTGEVVIRGDNVTPGYVGNDDANCTAFQNGWFRTGDQGYLDEDGYLFLTGRLKEIINRGGEKISPREVDEVLLGHPAIEQAVAFAVAHEQLGEEIGVAVIRKEGHSLNERDVREYAASRLADFKVPRVVKLVDAIPKGPTGKLQRIGLADKLGVQPMSVP
ncbi:MAG: AMP-binding protein, partial [bacterium]|nr:AMP-binding protein [bacterium]